MAVKLIYQAYANLLSGMVLHARSETAGEIKILALRPPSGSCRANTRDPPRHRQDHQTRPNHHRTTTMDRRRIS